MGYVIITWYLTGRFIECFLNNKPLNLTQTTQLADSVEVRAAPGSYRLDLNPAHHRVIAQSANLSYTVVGAIALAQIAYSQGQRPHWSTALPFYGQHPVIAKSPQSISAS